MNKNKKPQIRFKGFVDDWKQCKWKDNVDISTNMVNPQTGDFDSLPHIGPGNIESFTGQFYDNIKLVVEENLISGKFHFFKGDIIYGKINPQLAKYVFVDFEGLSSADAYVLNAKNQVNQKYLFSVLQTQKFYKYAVSVSMRSGMPKINREELNEYEFLAPILNEQEKVGTLFLTIDNIITLHQCKIKKLVKMKNALLEKMFPKDNNKIPEMRFKGFTDDWEQCKYMSLAKTRRGLTYKPSDISKDGIRVLRSSNISGDTFIYNEDDVFVNKNAINIEYVKNNEILITSANGSTKLVGKHALIKGVADISAVHGGFMLLATPNENPEFLNASMSSNWYRKFIDLYVAGGNGAIGNLSKSDLDDQDVFIPSSVEQKKIGTLFAHLDNLIILHKYKLDKIKKIKKSLQRKMFV